MSNHLLRLVYLTILSHSLYASIFIKHVSRVAAIFRLWRLYYYAILLTYVLTMVTVNKYLLLV